MRTTTLVRLAIVNAVGFSASTVMPLWLGGIARQFHLGPWFAGAAVFAQLGGAALFNLLTPALFRRVALLPLARVALVVAALAYLLAVTPSPVVFLTACAICGSALGVVLNVTNRLMGSAEHVQRGYAVFVLVEVLFASAMFLGCAWLISRYGLLALFLVVSATAAAASALLMRLPVGRDFAAALHVAGPPPNRLRAGVALGSFALFFMGQAALNSFMPTIGLAAGLEAYAANRVIAFGMIFALIGAALARIVGERVKPMTPIAIVVAALACLGPLLTLHPSPPSFLGGMIILGISTIFCVPYFYAQLAAYDHAGRYAAFGPAMMLIGIALGPSAAVLIHARLGLPTVGLFSAALLGLGGLGFGWAARGYSMAPIGRDSSSHQPN